MGFFFRLVPGVKGDKTPFFQTEEEVGVLSPFSKKKEEKRRNHSFSFSQVTKEDPPGIREYFYFFFRNKEVKKGRDCFFRSWSLFFPSRKPGPTKIPCNNSFLGTLLRRKNHLVGGSRRLFFFAADACVANKPPAFF